MLTLVAAEIAFRLNDTLLAPLFLLLSALYLMVSRMDSSGFFKKLNTIRILNVFLPYLISLCSYSHLNYK